MLKSSIEKLMRRENLEAATCEKVLDEMLSTEANEAQIAAFLVLLRAKKETAEELAAFVQSIKQKMIPISTTHKTLDIVGTGGDGANTVNISTASAILAASCGIKISKAGNRAFSSLAGSADVLEALGVNIELTPEKISRSIDEVGIAFCFSPLFHPAMHKLAPLRKKLNVPTTFNMLGPLLNPCSPTHILLGVFNENIMPLMAETLQKMGTERSLVVHGKSLDEMSCIGPVKILEITKNTIQESSIDPLLLGLNRCDISDLKGADAKTNAEILLSVLKNPSLSKNKAIADSLILNAAAALYLYGTQPSIKVAIPEARENLHSGKALAILKRMKEFSNEK